MTVPVLRRPWKQRLAADLASAFAGRCTPTCATARSNNPL
jgi:hypothetical protein